MNTLTNIIVFGEKPDQFTTSSAEARTPIVTLDTTSEVNFFLIYILQYHEFNIFDIL